MSILALGGVPLAVIAVWLMVKFIKVQIKIALTVGFILIIGVLYLAYKFSA